MRLVTRFAPSPTGYLHLGHIASLLYVFAIGRVVGADILLRIEDHDRERCRPEYEQAIIEDIAWLGMFPDNWEEVQKSTHDFRQSDCHAHYLQLLSHLEKEGRIYYCSCSRKEIMAGQPEGREELYYHGRCRTLGLKPEGEISTRLILPDEEVSFTDLLQGVQKQYPAKQCGDLLVRDRRGNWTYNFAVVADDIRQGVNLVIRGQDIMECTGRQVLLARMIDPAHTCRYLHHPLICDAEGKKLSKRFFSEAVAKRRQAGEAPEDLFGELLFHLGIISRKEPVSLKEALAVLGSKIPVAIIS